MRTLIECTAGPDCKRSEILAAIVWRLIHRRAVVLAYLLQHGPVQFGLLKFLRRKIVALEEALLFHFLPSLSQELTVVKRPFHYWFPVYNRRFLVGSQLPCPSCG
jgi:hypothetical protein